MSRAQEEARNTAMLNAMQQAQAEQAQQASLGAQLLGASYLPQAQMLDALTPAIRRLRTCSSGTTIWYRAVWRNRNVTASRLDCFLSRLVQTIGAALDQTFCKVNLRRNTTDLATYSLKV